MGGFVINSNGRGIHLRISLFLPNALIVPDLGLASLAAKRIYLRNPLLELHHNDVEMFAGDSDSVRFPLLRIFLVIKTSIWRRSCYV